MVSGRTQPCFLGLLMTRKRHTYIACGAPKYVDGFQLAHIWYIYINSHNSLHAHSQLNSQPGIICRHIRCLYYEDNVIVHKVSSLHGIVFKMHIMKTKQVITEDFYLLAFPKWDKVIKYTNSATFHIFPSPSSSPVSPAPLIYCLHLSTTLPISSLCSLSFLISQSSTFLSRSFFSVMRSGN